jgi:hypothetical protein
VNPPHRVDLVGSAHLHERTKVVDAGDSDIPSCVGPCVVLLGASFVASGLVVLAWLLLGSPIR